MTSKKATLVNKCKDMHTATNATRVVISIALLASSYKHLENPFLFVSQIAQYGLVPAYTVVLIAMFLPILQAFLAYGLLIRAHVAVSSLVSAVLFAVFFSAQLTIVLSGNTMSCGCFGAT